MARMHWAWTLALAWHHWHHWHWHWHWHWPCDWDWHWHRHWIGNGTGRRLTIGNGSEHESQHWRWIGLTLSFMRNRVFGSVRWRWKSRVQVGLGTPPGCWSNWFGCRMYWYRSCCSERQLGFRHHEWWQTLKHACSYRGVVFPVVLVWCCDDCKLRLVGAKTTAQPLQPHFPKRVVSRKGRWQKKPRSFR